MSGRPGRARGGHRARQAPLAAGSIWVHADVAQLVEHNLAKVGVAGSNPVVRSQQGPRCGSLHRVGALSP